jgi:hypothetical protein
VGVRLCCMSLREGNRCIRPMIFSDDAGLSG